MFLSRARCAALSFSLFAVALAQPLLAADPVLDAEMSAVLAARPASPKPLAAMSATPCVGGLAGIYPCSNIDL
ncbi:MAG: hypothetical protein ABIW82_09840, partial [Dokdonella sp.]